MIRLLIRPSQPTSHQQFRYIGNWQINGIAIPASRASGNALIAVGHFGFQYNWTAVFFADVSAVCNPANDPIQTGCPGTPNILYVSIRSMLASIMLFWAHPATASALDPVLRVRKKASHTGSTTKFISCFMELRDGARKARVKKTIRGMCNFIPTERDVCCAFQ